MLIAIIAHLGTALTGFQSRALYCTGEDEVQSMKQAFHNGPFNRNTNLDIIKVMKAFTISIGSDEGNLPLVCGADVWLNNGAKVPIKYTFYEDDGNVITKVELQISNLQ